MTTAGRPLELWGGVECTVNRIGDRFCDQVRRSGHEGRPDDLARFAALGIRALRYPVLWERVVPGGLDAADWSWTDWQLSQLRALAVAPIATLLHHGSGPRDTHLLDPAFPARLEAYAAAVAQRYPWLTDYTPVNEPLTTARFSALYGHWYPHRQDSRSFVRALMHEIVGTARAMRAIRRVTPHARLIQTEDAGRVRSTAPLRAQAEFENQRRWLTFDLLAGVVDRSHPLHAWLVDHGAAEAELAALCEHPCPADVVGVNYYLTSDRYLDHQLHRYPGRAHPGNQHQRYVDIEAVRVLPDGLAGHCSTLLDAWHRYHRPVALTEVHAGCTREDQVRWLVDAWDGARAARAAGADVHAVTLWSLLGSFDWDSLLTRDAGHYEPGAFDIRSNPPRPTAVAAAARALAVGAPLPPHAPAAGWWRRPGRLLPSIAAIHPEADAASVTEERGALIVVAGSGGRLGSALVRACVARGLPHVGLGRAELDITRPESIAAMLEHYAPWAVVNAAGCAWLDGAGMEAEVCGRVNVEGAGRLARACRDAGVRLVTYSSDQVFDGTSTVPYVETDLPAPLNAFGRSKRSAEIAVAAAHPGALVIRTSGLFGPLDDGNFVTTALSYLAAGLSFEAADDVFVSPTYLAHLADASLDLLIDETSGIWHLTNQGGVSWHELAVKAAARAGLNTGLVTPRPAAGLRWRARRPRSTVLDSRRGRLLPTLESAIDCCVEAAEWLRAPQGDAGSRFAFYSSP